MILSPFISWCAAQGVISKLQLCGESTPYRYMTYDTPPKTAPPPAADDGSSTSISDIKSILTTSPTISGNILQIPLSSCIIDSTPEKLSSKLAYEKSLGSKSNYAPYIDVLPSLESLQSVMPRFWNEDRKDLVYSGDGGQLEKRLKEDETRNVVAVDDWAYACVSSRANYVLGYGFAMTPILDMINHDSSIKTRAKIVPSSSDSTGGDNKDDGVNGQELHLFIEDSFALGDEVFISYGDLTNLDTLCNYGFVSDNNPCNAESVDVLLMGSPPVQVTIAEQGEGSIDETSLAILRSSIPNPSVMDNDNNGALDEEVHSLIASFLDEAIMNANEGAEKAMEKGDDLVATYLRCRANTLQKGLDNINDKFPQLF